MKYGTVGLFGGMSIELGKIGLWRHASGLTPEVVAEVEALGYGAIWVGGSPDGDLKVIEKLLVAAHLDAGADHVAVQVLGPDPLPALRALAGYLRLPSS